jgi:brefeldin A-inhibited guanine nucleotide-exchange protein
VSRHPLQPISILTDYPSLVNIITKLSSMSQPSQKNTESAANIQSPTTKPQNVNLAPSLSTSALGGPNTQDPTGPGLSEAHLRRQGLECLAAVLRSLVAWGTGKSTVPDELSHSATTPDASASHDRLPLPDIARGSTPDNAADDPSRFESAKQKKTTLMEGIKRFNEKPKKVRSVAVTSRVENFF